MKLVNSMSTKMIEPHTRHLNQTIINYWADRGYDVTQYEHRLVGGQPHSIKTVTTRAGNTSRHGVVHISSLDLQTLAKPSVTISALEITKGVLPNAAFIILDEVARKHNVSALAITAHPRGVSNVAHARFEFYYRLFNELMMTYTAIGRAVGGRQHCTVLRGIERHMENGGIIAPQAKVRKRRLIKFLNPDNKFIEAIISEVAEKYNVTADDIKGRSRYRRHIRPRLECYYRLSVELSMSSVNIGKAIGGRDHTTILYGIKKFKERLMEETNEQQQ